MFLKRFDVIANFFLKISMLARKTHFQQLFQYIMLHIAKRSGLYHVDSFEKTVNINN